MAGNRPVERSRTVDDKGQTLTSTIPYVKLTNMQPAVDPKDTLLLRTAGAGAGGFFPLALLFLFFSLF